MNSATLYSNLNFKGLVIKNLKGGFQIGGFQMTVLNLPKFT